MHVRTLTASGWLEIRREFHMRCVMHDEISRGVRSTASIAGHPLHPMLVPFPIAFLVGALASDLVFGQQPTRSGLEPRCGCLLPVW